MTDPASLDFVLTRTFDAPRALVFKAWTEREHLMKWFGPKGMTIAAAELDLRPGGSFHYCLRLPNGDEMWAKWVFREIVVPERLVLISSFSDASGALARAPMIEGWPLQTLSTTTFVERDGRTELTLRSSPYEATEAERTLFGNMHDSMRQGWGGTMERLEAYLEANPASR